MKSLTTIIILTLVFSTAFAQKSKNNPPGTVHLKDNIYIDTDEVTNHSWLEYQFYYKNKYPNDTLKYQMTQIDTANWGEYAEFANTFLKNTTYRHYPVVGMTYEQALDFCAFRTEAVNIYLYIKEHKIELPKESDEYRAFAEKVPKKVLYRLPTEEEWEMAANIPFSKKSQRKINKNEGMTGNFLKANNTDSTSVDLFAPTNSYYPNELGLYNLFGNVAEMTMQEGLAKGGAFIHPQEEINTQTKIPYENATCWLGFRCVAEMLE